MYNKIDEIDDFFERSNYKFDLEKNFMSNIFKVNWQDVKSALVSAVLIALIAILGYIYALGSIRLIDWAVLSDVGIFAAIPFVISVLKSWLTTADGKFLGFVKIK